jgi:predicted small metal-binding protein
MRQLACKDAGAPQCDTVLRGNTDEEIMSQARAHAQKEHGMAALTPELEQSLRQKIQNV